MKTLQKTLRKTLRKTFFKRAAILASAVFLFAMLLTSCGSSGSGAEKAEDYKADELVTLLLEKTELEYRFAPVEMLDAADAEKKEEIIHLTGLDKQISLVEDKIGFVTPLMGQEFQIVICKVKEDKDLDSVMKEILENSDLSRWICRRADQLIVTANGRHILAVMGTKEEAEKVANAFDSLFSATSAERLKK